MCKMKLAVCLLVAASGVSALTPPKSVAAATRGGSLEASALKAAAGASALTPPKTVAAATRGGSLEGGALKAAAPLKEVSAVPRGGIIASA